MPGERFEGATVKNDLQRVCAWCKKDMGTKPSTETGTTHGICPECLEKAEKDLTMTNVRTLEEKAEEGRALFGTARNGGSFQFEMRANSTYPVCKDHGRLFVDKKTGICDQCDREGKNPPLDEKAKNAASTSESFSFNGEKWKYEDGILYHFYIDRWIYKSEEPTAEKAKHVAETQSYVFSAANGAAAGRELFGRAKNKDDRPNPVCKKCSHPLLDHNNSGCWFPGCDCTRSRLENV